MLARTLFFVIVIVPFSLIAMPLQFIISRLNLPFWNVLPRIFHRLAARFIGLKITVFGHPDHGHPTLLVANHISWTDIIALGAVADVSFVARQEIGTWPVVGFMASLQKTIFVDRSRKADAKRTTDEMARRIADGNSVVLFAEGQSDIGTHVLPFRSALVGAAQTAMLEQGARNVMIQPMTIAYTHLQGMPVSRNERSMIAWIKSKSVGENIREILTGSTKSVTIAFGDPMPLKASDDRKIITQRCEQEVRAMLVALNRGEKLPVSTI